MSEDAIFDDVQPEVGDKLEALSKLCGEYKSLEREIEDIEEKLKLRKKDLEEVSRVKIPAILNATGLSEVKLSTGEKLKVEDKIQASIADKNYTVAYRNMIQAEGGDSGAEVKIDSLFKSQVVLDEVSDAVLDLLLEHDIPYNTVRSIHWQTLRKYCKERLENGLTIPEGISVFQYQETKISN